MVPYITAVSKLVWPASFRRSNGIAYIAKEHVASRYSHLVHLLPEQVLSELDSAPSGLTEVEATHRSPTMSFRDIL